MNKICTSIEQSQKLIELGIDINTADMLWTYDFMVGHINGINVISELLKPEENDIPAWSFMALNNIIKDNCERCEIHLRNDKKYNIFITSGTFIYRSFDTYPNGFDELVDACYEAVYWLKKKNIYNYE